MSSTPGDHLPVDVIARRAFDDLPVREARRIILGHASELAGLPGDANRHACRLFRLRVDPQWPPMAPRAIFLPRLASALCATSSDADEEAQLAIERSGILAAAKLAYTPADDRPALTGITLAQAFDSVERSSFSEPATSAKARAKLVAFQAWILPCAQSARTSDEDTSSFIFGFCLSVALMWNDPAGHSFQRHVSRLTAACCTDHFATQLEGICLAQ